MRINKLTITYLFILLLWISNSVHAEILLFKDGEKATYTISEKVDSELILFDAKVYSQAESKIDLEIKLLSSNQGSYPFNVEVLLKRINFSESKKIEKNVSILKYDSRNPETELAPYFNDLIEFPLNFTVEKDFKVVENTRRLEQIEDLNFPEIISLRGTLPWNFELLLTQLFHLSGENLSVANSYPVSCYQLIDEDLSEQEVTYQSSNYTINAIDENTIEASWAGNAQINSTEAETKGAVAVVSNVAWNVTNPMIQERESKIKIDLIEESFPLQFKISILQNWQLQK